MILTKHLITLGQMWLKYSSLATFVYNTFNTLNLANYSPYIVYNTFNTLNLANYSPYIVYNTFNTLNLANYSPYKVFRRKPKILLNLDTTPDIKVSGTFKDYHELLNKRLKCLHQLLKIFKFEKNC